MPASEKSKSKVSSKSKDKKSDKKSDKKDKKSDSKDKKSDKKDKKSDKDGKSEKSKSASVSPSKKDSKKDKLEVSKVEEVKADETMKPTDAMGELDMNNIPFGQTLGTVKGGFAAPGGGHVFTLGGMHGSMDRKKNCVLHKQPLRYFCDSCEELICYDCTVMGPHNTQLHRITSIEESFRYRFD